MPSSGWPRAAARTITAVALPVDGGLLESRAWPETDEDRALRDRGARGSGLG